MPRSIEPRRRIRGSRSSCSSNVGMRRSSWRWTLKDDRERLKTPRPHSVWPGLRPQGRGLRTGLTVCGVVAVLSLGMTGTAAPRDAARTPPRAPRPAPELVRIRFWTAPDHTRLVFDLSGPPPVEPQFRLAGPTSYEISIPKMRKSIAVTSEFVGDSLVADIFPSVSDSGVLVRVGLKQATTPLAFVLAAADGIPDRIVIDVPAPPNPQADLKLEQQLTEIKKSKRLVVAIDPGHGGDDTGALGYRRLPEADVVLAIAKKLRWELEQISGVSAFLTRAGDYFIPLRKRIELARKYQADIMISIHCNASRNRDATGTEVYFLSLTGATDEASRSFAEAENAADLIGGVPRETGDDLLGILFDLKQNDTVRRSSELAENLVDALRDEDRLSTRGVKQAGFVVLKAPEIPSVLVETAFISNPREAAMLKDAQFQSKVAERLADGVQAYMKNHARSASN
ncbi:MAG: N-acetylmuramoyl-L-alanine amidase [Candidatus Eisenbacteria bacterium]|uniref:N-acetylmuramoyl-L-alanine amidase n=1 Tax=Eiseniibacteriota bacterium TaxID=2212470 RepID=A0A538SUF4_UNCEI|nr:MAG: N-acetylmuramoyl-L-alanine amidase [Candidatus Eisenbacteria bacterium]TMQ66564.1 MAG: N-acetylmuramoyl-L-alanine amidase [Candidatus Eisenbacteria bacterium]